MSKNITVHALTTLLASATEPHRQKNFSGSKSSDKKPYGPKGPTVPSEFIGPRGLFYSSLYDELVSHDYIAVSSLFDAYQ